MDAPFILGFSNPRKRAFIFQVAKPDSRYTMQRSQSLPYHHDHKTLLPLAWKYNKDTLLYILSQYRILYRLKSSTIYDAIDMVQSQGVRMWSSDPVQSKMFAPDS